MPIGNHTGQQSILGQLLPNRIGMTGQHRRTAIAEMRADLGTSVDGISNLFTVCRQGAAGSLLAVWKFPLSCKPPMSIGSFGALLSMMAV